ncbi:ATP-binding cassette domain-containing protein [Burkholderia gladioli]|uniref:ATP-binding cassette domain-containing protein n=1 Tax=Burkholderia gladioli TaxID=28095 RepID=UPI00163FA565|nr:ABC transporter ATP-binding protein [Burkholderia gladioli]
MPEASSPCPTDALRAAPAFLAEPFHELFGRRRLRFAALVAGSTLLVVASIVPSFALATLVDYAFSQRSMMRLALVLLVLALVHGIEAMVERGWRRAMRAQCDEHARRLGDALVDRMAAAPLAALERKSAAAIHNRLRAIPRIVEFHLHWYVLIVSRPLFFGASLAWLFAANALLGSAILSITLVYVRLYWSASRKLREAHLLATERAEARSRVLHEFAQGVVTLRIAGRLREFHRASRTAQSGQHGSRRQARASLGELLPQLTQTFSNLAFIAVLGLGAYLVIRRQLSVGHLIVVNVVFRRVLSEARVLIARIRSYYRMQASIEVVRRFLDDLQASEGQRSLSAGVPDFERLELRSVGLVHVGAAAPSLREVDLTLRRGERLALVGDSGSGKTSLLKMIAGFYLPTSGRIEVIGGDARTQRVAYMSAADMIFSRSVARNIALHRDLSRDQIVEAARIAQADGFLSQLRDGYDTRLDPAGGGLSQGQRARLALARCLASDASLLLLDEPTGALDPDSEAALLHALRAWRGERTVVVATHRPAPALEADHVAVMRDGRVIEHGAPQRLLAQPDSAFSAWCRLGGGADAPVHHPFLEIVQ